MRLTAVGSYALTAGVLVSAWRLLLPRGLVVVALLIWLLLPGFYYPWVSLQAWSSVYARGRGGDVCRLRCSGERTIATTLVTLALVLTFAADKVAYARTKPMLVEGRAVLFATLVTNRRKPGPFYVDWHIPGLDLAKERARFVLAERPLIFQQQGRRPSWRGRSRREGIGGCSKDRPARYWYLEKASPLRWKTTGLVHPCRTRRRWRFRDVPGV